MRQLFKKIDSQTVRKAPEKGKFICPCPLQLKNLIFVYFKSEKMDRIGNMLLCLISFVGIIASLDFAYKGSRPCGGDGCLIRLDLYMGAVIFLISAPVFFVTLKREIARHQK
jgi:hypothetical protein